MAGHRGRRGPELCWNTLPKVRRGSQSPSDTVCWSLGQEAPEVHSCPARPAAWTGYPLPPTLGAERIVQPLGVCCVLSGAGGLPTGTG